jgi:hypothetical protein
VVNSNVMLFVNSTGTFSTPVQNSATIVADASTVTFSGPVNNSGWIVATNGALQFASSVTNSGAILFGPDQFHVTSVSAAGNDVVITWQAFGGNRYRLQASTDLASGFGDISPEVATVGNGIMSTNCVDVGGLTNSPSRFYRVRQVW